MIKLGLLGKNIKHSKSQEMYEQLLEREIKYSLFDFSHSDDIPPLENIFSKIQGLSITAPYKKYFFDDVYLSEEAKVVGAINCIQHQNGQYVGHNTDYLAALELVGKYGFNGESNIIVLGNGPVAKMIALILERNEVSYLQLFRTPEFQINNFDMSRFDNESVSIINCLSRGVVFSPDFKGSAINKFWDLNYSQESLFSSFYKNNYIDGLDLLRLQAKFALNIWGIK